ncbi:hypothetical protein SSX86_002842 [Deinandra increscens subsp. villosa]|uniref:Replication protein A OB domain-containing protein n=1 Tax=Deinandra increscens subsp. villosa TaxID=3103831 RepID=A0AAP0DPV4_9ASTR
MDSASLTLIRQLDAKKHDVVMKLRIIQLRKRPLFSNPSETYSIEMVLMDEEGAKIQGSVFKKWVFRFEKLLRENADFYVHQPEVTLNTSNYNYLSSPNKLTYGCETRLVKCADFKGALFGFCFVGFQQLLDREVPDGHVVDVVGHVVQIYELERVPIKEGKVTERLNLHVHDTEDRLVYVTLWGEYAKQMANYVAVNGVASAIVIILQFGIFRFYRDRATVSNTYGISRLFINEEVEAITEYRERLVAKDSTSEGTVSRPIMHSSKDDFLLKYAMLSIAGIKGVTSPKKVVVVGTIKQICVDGSWYYFGCTTCTKKVVPVYELCEEIDGISGSDQREIMKCTNRNCTANVLCFSPRFRIEAVVQDMSGSVSITLFDREITKIVKLPARVLLEKYQQGERDRAYPIELDDLLDKKLACILSVTNYNFEKNSQDYGVDRISEDPSVISELEAKLQSEQVTVKSDAYSLHSICVVGSFPVGETTPPSSVMASMGTMQPSKEREHIQSAAHGSVKRSLNEVYSIEASSSRSTSKPRAGNLEAHTAHGNKGTTHLLTPKKEK